MSTDHETTGDELDLAALLELIERLTGRLETAESLISQVVDELADTPPGGPWAWRYLSPEQSTTLFRQLREWVDWLVMRYGLEGEERTILPCWYQHPVVVEELTGLYVAWLETYAKKERHPSANLIAWHDRWLWPCLHRLNKDLNVWHHCRGGNHSEPRTTPSVTDDTAFDAFLNTLTNTPAPDASGVRVMDADAVHDALDDGQAVALLPGDPTTPIRLDGQWYAIPDTSTKGDWIAQNHLHQAALESAWNRQRELEAIPGGRR